MSHETFKQSAHGAHGNAQSDLQLWGGKLTKGSSCALKSITDSMLRFCLSVHWAVSSHGLRAS